MNSTRRRFFAASAGAMWLAACHQKGEGTTIMSPPAGAPRPMNSSEEIAADIKLLNKGIVLEQGAILAYQAAAGLPFIKTDTHVLAIAGQFLSHHKEHRDALIATVEQLGGEAMDYGLAKAPAIPRAILDDTRSSSERKVATIVFARDLERKAAEAYHRLLASQLSTDEARRGALEIFPAEAMHVAVYDLILHDLARDRGKGVMSAGLFSQQV